MYAKKAIRLMVAIGNGGDVPGSCGLLDDPDFEVR